MRERGEGLDGIGGEAGARVVRGEVVRAIAGGRRGDHWRREVHGDGHGAAALPLDEAVFADGGEGREESGRRRGHAAERTGVVVPDQAEPFAGGASDASSH